MNAKLLTGCLDPYYLYTAGNGVVLNDNIWK